MTTKYHIILKISNPLAFSALNMAQTEEELTFEYVQCSLNIILRV